MRNTIVDTKIALSDLENMIIEVVKDYGTDFVKRKKMYVTEGAHTDDNGNNVITVQEAFGEPFEVPFVPDLYNAQPGDSVWVEWAYGLGNACAVNSGSWKKTFITADANGVSLYLDELQAAHIGGDVVNTQTGKNVAVNGKIQDVIDSLGKHLTGDVNVTVPADTYVEDVNICGFGGSGTLTLSFDKAAIVNGDWTISGNARVNIVGDTDGTDTTRFIGSFEDSVMNLTGNKYVKISGVEIHGVERESGDSGQDFGVLVKDGSYAYVTGCQIDRTGAALYVEHAHLDIVNCTGGYADTDETTVANLVDGVVISPDGGYVNAKGSIPIGTDVAGTGYTANGWPFTCSGTVTPVASGGTPPPPVTEVTSTWTASAGYYCASYKTGTEAYNGRATGWGSVQNNPRMGYDSNTKRYMAGLWIFSDADTIASTLSGATITKATVSITRTDAGGASSGIVIIPYYHNITAATIGNFVGNCNPWSYGTTDDKYYYCGCNPQYIELGATGTFELPNTEQYPMYSLLQNGSIKGFAVGMNAESNFFQFAKLGCTLTVTYEV